MQAKILSPKPIEEGHDPRCAVFLQVEMQRRPMTVLFLIENAPDTPGGSLQLYAMDGTPKARNKLGQLWRAFIGRPVHIPDLPWPRRVIEEFAKWLRRQP